MAISIGDALLKLGVDTKDLDRGMKGIGASIKKHQKAIGIGMVAAGGAILAAGALSIKTYAEMGDEIHKMALRTGFATEALSRLKYAAEIGGATLGDVEKGFKKMAMSVSDAKDGLATYTREFDKIGINVQELEGLNPEEQFLKIALAVAAVEDPTQRSSSAMKIFGRAGTALLPMLEGGAEGLKEMMAEAEKFAPIFDKEAAEAAARLTDQMGQLSGATNKVKMVIAEQLVPILIPLIDKIRDAVAGISAWMEEHSGLTKVLVIGAAVLGGLLITLGGLLLILPSLAGGIHIVTGAVVGLNISLGVLVGLLAAVTLGLAMMGFGIIKLMEYRAWEQRILKEQIRYEEEYQKALAGEANILYQLIEANLEEVKARIETGEATQEQIEWLEKYSEAAQSYIELSKAQIEVTEDETEALENKRLALEALIATQERAFAQAKEGISIRAPIGPEERASYIAERNRFEDLARVAGAAGRVEEAAWYAMQAAAIQSRLTQLPHGGIAMRPMVASIAEKQPEAVIPLDKLTGIIGGYKTANILVELDGRLIGRAVGQPLVDEIRLRTGVHS